MNPLHLRFGTAALAAAGFTALGTPALAASLTVGVEIPRLQVAEYHRPYVAVWIERADNSVASTLAVWYDLKMQNREGEKWLKDLRQWWRRSGRSLQMPVDGVSAATRAVGTHSLRFNSQDAAFKALPAGEYRVVVEAAREVGGHEAVRVPFTWGPMGGKPGKPATAKGSSELGAVTVSVK